jgi:hypothetical protein
LLQLAHRHLTDAATTVWTRKKSEVTPPTAYFANHLSGCMLDGPGTRNPLLGDAKLQRALRSTLMARVDFYVYGFDDMKGGETVLLGDRDGCLELSEVTKSET